MQLKKTSRIGAALASATCGLLGAAHAAEVTVSEPAGWRAETSLLYYGEDGGRVKDTSLGIAVRRAWEDGSRLSGTLTIDSLTGASPTGATPSDRVQTFTRPSGSGQYTVAPGSQPLDDTFKDTRIALSVDWAQLWGEDRRFSAGASFSNEYDYQHLGVNGRVEQDFNQRNTTVQLGLAIGKDSMDPVGGAPIGLALMRAPGDASSKRGSESKTVIDFLAGVTQVVDRRSLLVLNYAYGQSSGYLSDPYKLLSVVDATTGRDTATYRYELRPDSRRKHSLFGEWRYAFDRDSMAVNYRFMLDDWGIQSHTLEGRYRWNFNEHSYLEPHLRYYRQSAADFYRTYLVSGQALPAEASADYRLAQMNAYTAGMKYALKTSVGEFSARLEYYRQNPKADGSFGILNNYELAPPLTAIIAQIGYRLDF